MCILWLAGLGGNLAWADPVEAAPKPPAADVQKLAMMCLHWSGEAPYDEERSKAIAKGVQESCEPGLAAAEKQLEAVEKNPEMAAAVVDLIAHMGAAKRFDMKALCEAAAPKWKESEDDPVYFKMACPAQARVVLGTKH